MGNQVLYPHISNFTYRYRRMHMGILECKRGGIAKKFAYWDSRIHNEVVRVRGLTYTYIPTLLRGMLLCHHFEIIY